MFIRPPYENVSHGRYSHHTNRAINLSNIISVGKVQVKYYPDNDGIPGIEFCYSPNTTVCWYLNNSVDQAFEYDQIIHPIISK